MRFIFGLFCLFSCGEKIAEKIDQGKLEDLIIGELVIKKDLETRYLHNIKVLRNPEMELLYYVSFSQTRNAGVYKFHDIETGGKIYEFDIPLEGPNAMKGGTAAAIAVSKNRIISIGRLGQVGIHDAKGKKLEKTITDFNLSNDFYNMVRLDGRRGHDVF